MIVGVGLDLVDIAHFKKIIEKGGVAFYKKILTPMELKEVRAMSVTRQINFGAKRYAVKEAFAKADVAFLCLPDAEAIEAVELAGEGTAIIDTSTAHRTASP